MDTADSQRLSRLSKMLLAGTGVAFAWVLLSFTLGLATSQAHADDDGLLGGASAIIEDGSAAVTGVGSDAGPAVVEPAAEVIAPVLDAAPVTPVGVVQGAVSTVGSLPAAGVVSPAVDTSLDVVDAVPVLGGVVSDLGVDTAVGSVGSSVDGVLRGGTTTVVDTVSGIVSPMGGVAGSIGGVITDPAVVGLDGLQGAATSAVADTAPAAAAGPLETLARAAYLAGATAWLTLSSDLPAALSSSDSVFVNGSAVGGVLALVRSVMQADSVLIGPGGAGPGAWVLVALGFVVAYRAWVRRSGLENDVAPAAPVPSTDVSPD